MNIFKSLFISMYMMAAMAITVIAAWSLWNTGNYITWGGVVLVTAPFMMVISWLMMSKNLARTSAHFPLLNALGAIGVVLASWGYFQGASINAPILALVGWISFIVYAFWYSDFGRRPSAQLKIGQTLEGRKNSNGTMLSPIMRCYAPSQRHLHFNVSLLDSPTKPRLRPDQADLRDHTQLL